MVDETTTTRGTDLRLAAVQRAVKAAALALMAREQTAAEVVAALAAAVGCHGEAQVGITPRERVAAVRQSRREQMLAELLRYEQAGRGRASVMLVARKFGSDPVEVASIARSLRRWRPQKKGQCPFTASQTS